MWLEYLKLVKLARNLVRAERSADWTLHLKSINECLAVFAAPGHYNYLKSAYLYVSEMKNLEETYPHVANDFKQGLFVVRRTDIFWASISMDLSTEQILLRALKTRGGLTHGSGLTDEMCAV